jgi:NitT/TauT family transport system ATP-binding protein
METAINWGRYAELFDFDASRRRFIQPERLSNEIDAQSNAEIDA